MQKHLIVRVITSILLSNNCTMRISTQLSQQDFINANFATMLTRRTLRFVLYVYALLIVISVATTIGSKERVLPGILPAVIILGIFAMVFYFSIKKAYTSNPRAGERIDYIFTDEKLEINGESFSSEMTWKKVPRVTLTKSWLMIWQNSQYANVIPRAGLDEFALKKIKDILTGNSVTNNI